LIRGNELQPIRPPASQSFASIAPSQSKESARSGPVEIEVSRSLKTRRLFDSARPGLAQTETILESKSAIDDLKILRVLEVDSKLVQVVNGEVPKNDLPNRFVESLDSIAKERRGSYCLIVMGDFKMFQSNVTRAVQDDGRGKIVARGQNRAFRPFASNDDPSGGSPGRRPENVLGSHRPTPSVVGMFLRSYCR
jgi:hypothetical protein